MLEETFELLNQPQCEAYLERLNLPWPRKADRAFLNTLMERHLAVIPFENLDTALLGRPIRLDTDNLYEKIIQNRRGGYCFELNALFLGLLRGLGYEAWPAGCRVLCRPGLPPIYHRASVVLLKDALLFCDVGFGGICSSRPVMLMPGTVTDTNFASFSVTRECRGWLNLHYTPHGTPDATPQPLLMICEAPSAPQDFFSANETMSAPASVFSQKIMVQKLTPWGSWSINGDILTRHTASGKETVTLENREVLEECLRRDFSLAF